MPRGGFRPGAGRPRGSKNRPKAKRQAAAAPATAATAADDELTPLRYMLDVMRNPEADESRRDRMAIAAAGLVHPKPTETGKKQKRLEDAKELLDSGRFAPAQAPLGLTQPNKLN